MAIGELYHSDCVHKAPEAVPIVFYIGIAFILFGWASVAYWLWTIYQEGRARVTIVK